MTLELEKLAEPIARMASSTARQRLNRQAEVADLLDRLHAERQAWDRLAAALTLARQETDVKFFRAARPLDQAEPLDANVPPPQPPEQATLIATDGSQILPDRHAPYLYYLINIGLIVYHHGADHVPQTLTLPELNFPAEDEAVDTFVDHGGVVSLRRDLAEIEALATAARDNWHEPRPLLALLDQRLLYWPIGGVRDHEGSRILEGWQTAMTSLREQGAWLAGYIDRPGKRSVVTMLKALNLGQPGFDPQSLVDRGRRDLTDTDLFRELLRPGHRSKVFVDISTHNSDFARRDPLNEVCFFYFNPGRSGRQIARVDLPLAVAADPAAVAAIHGLLVDQCHLLGGYPYVLTRADEIAVVGTRDQEDLELMIDAAMQRQGISAHVTAKQLGKEIARAGRSRHTL